MRLLISIIIATAMAAFCSFSVSAEGAERNTVTDEQFLNVVENALDWERSRINSDSLIEGYISQGIEGESEADWFVLAEYLLGLNDDYESYCDAAEKCHSDRLNGDSEYLTEYARTALVLKICGDVNTDLSSLSIENAADNEIIWLAISQCVNGYDYTYLLEEIEARQDTDGSFGRSDIDVTAMALVILEKDSESSRLALAFLSEQFQGTQLSCEADAWLIIGLCAQGINPSQSLDFTRENGVRPIDELLEFESSDGGFCHSLENESNTLSTYQSLIALTALAKYSDDGEGIFDALSIENDIYALKNLSCEGFDDYDMNALEEIAREVSATDLEQLEKLSERAELYEADEQTKQALSQAISESEMLCEQIEELNSYILENAYPLEKAHFTKYTVLCEINEKSKAFSDKDQSLILSFDEIDDAIKRVRREIIVAILAILILIFVITFMIVRKIKHGKQIKSNI